MREACLLRHVPVGFAFRPESPSSSLSKTSARQSGEQICAHAFQDKVEERDGGTL
ncbi:unnamed protein product [Chondrus crispus]|uniref:Uncharacterized protein n=1 Tax=Chondrus crispus TaxID=2769 RepID=R7Q8P6_CHOCR|nr:unnamed protein product [Chondrus crispus]CDF34173.1 unnamed protein product [Chondrus crispus]|eukprot:XP_005713992.1 unnamed protein product [Chondrus crispus]